MIDYDALQKQLGFTEEQKQRWCEAWSGQYANDAEKIKEGWNQKLLMHAYPVKTAAVYVMPSYQSPVSGKWIDSPRQRREDLKANGCREWEGMSNEKHNADRQRQYEESAQDAKLEACIGQTLAGMSSEQKAALTTI